VSVGTSAGGAADKPGEFDSPDEGLRPGDPDTVGGVIVSGEPERPEESEGMPGDAGVAAGADDADEPGMSGIFGVLPPGGLGVVSLGMVTVAGDTPLTLPGPRGPLVVGLATIGLGFAGWSVPLISVAVAEPRTIRAITRKIAPRK
jgi:hypothetical protein